MILQKREKKKEEKRKTKKERKRKTKEIKKNHLVGERRAIVLGLSLSECVLEYYSAKGEG
jgi:hypothetical protein